ncbi:Nn.00g067500.m01.CDS01 [Neocucurbitaria sp. VM-36]
MSAEEGAAQPPAAGHDKAPAAKAATTFTSFINKNTTGKKFAPKAARRRPGAAPAAAASEPPASAASQPGTTAQLPTPAATQEPRSPNASRTTFGRIGSPTAPTVASHVQEPPSIVTEPLSTPASTGTGAPPQGGQESQLDSQIPPREPPTVPTIEDEPELRRAPKRRRVDPTAPKGPNAASEAVVNEGNVESSAIPIQQDSGLGSQQQPEEQVSVAVAAPVITAGSEELATETDAVQFGGEDETAPQPRRRGRLPWVAVNHPQDNEDVAVSRAPTMSTRETTRTQGRKKILADGGTEDAEQEEGEPQSVQKRPSAKARGKRKATIASVEDNVETQPHRKRSRRPRTYKEAEGARVVEAGNEEAEHEANGGEEVSTRRKQRQPKRKKRQSTEGAGEGGAESAQPKRKGRPPREPTPSDAEDQTIDPQITFMDGLASRNIRVGKLSNREKQMREIDWEAVKQRRREEDARPIRSKEEQDTADTALNEAALNAQQGAGVRIHLVNGTIQMVPNTGTVNREADADREIADYEIIEDRDITSRITSRSFMKNNKRFPNDFVLPGQGRRWNRDSTDLFYQGLKSFGTDFQMISHMFPGSTRRSIKTKFTREERENPERIREALQGRSEIATHWDIFLEASQMREDSFVDADEIKRQLAEDEARMRELIAAAAEETRQRNLQKAAAGVLDDEDVEAENGNKENGKGKKKRKERGKQVTFQEEKGVEIVGSLEDDPTWGQQ